MIATNEAVLTGIVTEAVTALTPRLQYKGAEKWKPHDRDTGPATTRRFRVLMGAGNLQPRGAMAGHIFEHFAELRIRTDYAGDHAQQQHIVTDDFHQIGDALTALKDASEANGIVVVERIAPRAVRGRVDDTDTIQIDHTYRIRYMRNIRP